MDNPDDILPAGENIVSGSGLMEEEKRNRISDGTGSVAADVSICAKPVVQSNFDINSSSLVETQKEQLGVQNLNLCSVSSSGTDVSVDDGGSSCGVIAIKHGSHKKREGSFKGDDECVGSVCKKHDHHRVNVEKLDDKEFCVGDFVWGKIKSRPWWPGQVFDSRDASDIALKHIQDGRLLIAFFGDGSCSWCLPSQLTHFVENFNKMSVDSSSKSFVNAIQNAVDEVGRLVESNLTCNCVLSEKRDGLSRPVISNVAVKAGVLAPEVDMDRLTVPSYTPLELLSKVEYFAKAFPIDSMLEFALVRSWLSAFYRANGGHRLPTYSEPCPIEGMEDKSKNTNEVGRDCSDPIKVSSLDQQYEDCNSSPTVNAAMSLSTLDNENYHERKLKSVDEHKVEQSLVEPVSQMKDVAKDAEKSTSWTNIDEGGSGNGKMGRKRNWDEITVPNAESEDELKNISMPRERKKSKYLCPPYTSTNWIENNDNIHVDPVGKHRMRSDGNLEGSDTSPTVSRKELTICLSDVNVSVDEVLSDIQIASVDVFYLRKKGAFDMVWGFVSALRKATHLHGQDYEVFKRCRSGRKKTKSASPCLTLTFSPSKEEIVNVFSKFGILNEKKTNLSADSRCAQVVYLKECDALRLDEREKTAAPSQSQVYEVVSDVVVMRQKLKIVGETLENCHAKLSVDEKSMLKDEMKNLLRFVESVSDKVEMMAENNT